MARSAAKRNAGGAPSRRGSASKRPSPASRHVLAIQGLDGVCLVKVAGTRGTVLELRHHLRMRRETFGRLVNVSVRTLADVETKHSPVEKLRRNYVEVKRLYDSLTHVVDARTLGTWFDTPNQMFGGLKPLDLVERGEIDRLWEMFYRLRSGMPS